MWSVWFSPLTSFLFSLPRFLFFFCLFFFAPQAKRLPKVLLSFSATLAMLSRLSLYLAVFSYFLGCLLCSPLHWSPQEWKSTAAESAAPLFPAVFYFPHFSYHSIGFPFWFSQLVKDKESLTATDGNRERSQPLHRWCTSRLFAAPR